MKRFNCIRKIAFAIFVFHLCFIIGSCADYETGGGEITIISPEDGIVVTEQAVTVRGKAEGFTRIILIVWTDSAETLQEVDVDDDGSWEATITIGDPVITEDLAVEIFAQSTDLEVTSNIVSITRIPSS